MKRCVGGEPCMGEVTGLGELEKRALMHLQYEFPLTPDPVGDTAHALGVDRGLLLSRLRELVKEGKLKRIGFYFNFRAARLVGALVAYRALGQSFNRVVELLNMDPLVTHNFERSHPRYNIWAVMKAESREKLIEKAEGIASEAGAGDLVILFSKRTLKLSVKYDLYTGISRAGRWSMINPSPPAPEELGATLQLAKDLRVLPLVERPYRVIGEKHRLSEDEVLEKAERMLREGILGDPGAALDGHRIGFTENAMTVVAGDGLEEACKNIVNEVPEATHVVFREPYPPGKWRHNCYFMTHATSRRVLEERIGESLARVGVDDYMIIYSLRDLKPGVIR